MLPFKQLAVFLFLSFAPALAQAKDIAPEPATQARQKQEVITERYMAVTAHPLASEAAEAMLEKGGSAVDAAIAAQMVLNLVEPQSSGIGGGGFLVYYDAETGEVTTYDGRESAPKNVTEWLFYRTDDAGKPLEKMDFMDAVKSGKAVGVPGLLRMLKLAHDQQGKLPWEALFSPAITYAEEGFPASVRMVTSILYALSHPTSERFVDLYTPTEGKQVKAGETFTNPEFAETLRTIAEGGVASFYEGELAGDVVKTVQQAEIPGALTVEDLAGYEANQRAPLCGHYRSYRVCGMGMPSSGPATILQVLGMVEQFKLNQYEAMEPEALHILLEAMKLAYADRNRYWADSDVVAVPIHELLSRDYLASRGRLIEKDAVMTPAEPGQVMTGLASNVGEGGPSTTHLSIVDAEGNAVSMTTSVEHSFGSSLVTNGFVLNNQLTDFSFEPEQDGMPIANRVEPGKRPRSSMSPLMIFDSDGALRWVLGSPGGSSIIPYVLQTAIALMDWGLSPQEAVALPHVYNKNKPESAVEIIPEGTELAEALRAIGHTVKRKPMASGLHVIAVQQDGAMRSGVDPRREGAAAGE